MQLIFEIFSCKISSINYAKGNGMKKFIILACFLLLAPTIAGCNNSSQFQNIIPTFTFAPTTTSSIYTNIPIVTTQTNNPTFMSLQPLPGYVFKGQFGESASLTAFTFSTTQPYSLRYTWGYVRGGCPLRGVWGVPKISFYCKISPRKYWSGGHKTNTTR